MSDRHPLTRRSFTSGVVLGLAGAWTLPFAAVRAQEGTPEISDGGVLRIGILGSGTQETLDPVDVSTMAAWVRATTAYETLTIIDNGQVVNVLAESITPNDDATVWTVRLREGITFHDGSPLTAADGLANFVANPSPFALWYHAYLTNVNPETSRVIDDLTFEIGLLSPNGTFPDSLWTLHIMPEGFADFATATNGTGPYTVESFTPGDRAIFARVENSWRADQAHLDGIEIIVINEPEARYNALVSGQIDVAVQLSATHALQLSTMDDFDLVPIVSGSRHTPGFTMRVDTPPFDDPEVRLAMRLAIDRRQIVDTVGFGFGEVVADTFVVGGRYYNDALVPREQDLDRARSIIQTKGLAGASVEILTSTAEAGFIETSTLYAESLNAIGLDATLNIVPPDTFWSDLGALIQAPLKSSVAGLPSYLEYAAYAYATEGAFNFSGYSSPEMDELIATAIATLDEEERQRIAHRIQEILWEDGPDVVPAVLDANHGTRAGVGGITTPTVANYTVFTDAYINE